MEFEQSAQATYCPFEATYDTSPLIPVEKVIACNKTTYTWYIDNNEYTAIRDNRCITFRRNGWLHRDNDKPTAIYNSGQQYWFHNGDMHRDIGPAIITADG